MKAHNHHRRGPEPRYGETKEPITIALTPTGVNLLDDLAAQFSLSRSEFVEQIARQIIPLKLIMPRPQNPGKILSSSESQIG